MKIMLTGAGGQVGREVIEQAKQAGYELFAFSKADLDLTKPQALVAAVEAHHPQVLINAAAYTAVDKAEQEPENAFAINRDAVGHLAAVCKSHDLPLIHVSTDYVFDGSKHLPYTEEDPRAPLNVYGASKAEGEALLEASWEKHLIVRTSWVFGRYGHNFIKTILKLALKQKELRIVADQVGCPTAAKDLAAALLSLASQVTQGQKQWGTFHYCGGKPTNWFEFAQRIIEQGKALFPFQLEAIDPIMTADYPTPAKRPLHSVLGTEKIKKTYGLQPSDWEAVLPLVIEDIHASDELREFTEKS